MALPNVAILGDSRVFDTYFLTPAYGENRYGYDATFPHLLRGKMLREPDPRADIVHIPDHFRGASIANNILRLALTDPAMVVLVEGIWESLLTKQHFIDYATRKIRLHPWRRGGSVDLEFSSAKLAALFVDGELSVGPDDYRDRQERLVSHFRRRRRQVVWATLPIPPADHLNGVHPAGNYKPIKEWGDCLRAINDALVPMIEVWGGIVLDLDELMRRHGGAAACLIDQWHFSASFHAVLADEIGELIDAGIRPLPADHVSHNVMLPGPIGDQPICLQGTAKERTAWRADNPEVTIAAEAAPGAAAGKDADIVLLLGAPDAAREETARRILAGSREDVVVIYPEELLPIKNPATADQTQHAILR